ncbi:MAG TPA: glycoside hydrolase family 57 protein [Terriglobales bacterium]|nr:glycoside hydrolase family 57 protein [Terriglobales bacterium]
MPTIKLALLWHMHQPYYKDLVTGSYRLPWVRMHGLKDYYGMVKLLDEFPDVHQTFNLVPSLITQLQDYVAGTAKDPFLEVAAKPVPELSDADRRFVLQYLFQANVTHMIGRYPRYQELYQLSGGQHPDVDKALKAFQPQDYTDLQVLSQLAWFDEFFLDHPLIQALIQKGRKFSLADQRTVMEKQRELLAMVLPAYAAAAQRGSIEISASPFYHPILPLVCDTDMGRASTVGLPLPKQRFQHPEDAREQLRRGLDLQQQVFGVRPQGVWPSEGSVSDQVMSIAAELGVQWMATDEGVLARSLDGLFVRGEDGILSADAAHKLYNIYRYQQGDTRMHLFFRDHSLSDLIGFVYSGMDAQAAANDFLGRIKASAGSVVESGRDAVVPVILDGENAWEYFPASGREFLRRLYQAIQSDPQIESVTMSEAIASHREEDFAPLGKLVPGSWIHANFNVWIGAPEDNRAWDYLSAARDVYDRRSHQVAEHDRRLAFEELLIAEGSDWNWWYGPEHHSANDADFDDLYRKHLSNVYQALGETPPDYLAQPIAAGLAKAHFAEQVSYIHPRIDGKAIGYFDWLGAAHHVSDRRSSAMHGKKYFFDQAYAGIDEKYLYCRVDLTENAFARTSALPSLTGDFEITMSIEVSPQSSHLKIRSTFVDGRLKTTSVLRDAAENNGKPVRDHKVEVQAETVFTAKVPLSLLDAHPGSTIRLRFGFWQENLPLDSLPLESPIELKVTTEDELVAGSSEMWKV